MTTSNRPPPNLPVKQSKLFGFKEITRILKLLSTMSKRWWTRFTSSVDSKILTSKDWTGIVLLQIWSPLNRSSKRRPRGISLHRCTFSVRPATRNAVLASHEPPAGCRLVHPPDGHRAPRLSLTNGAKKLSHVINQ